MRQVKIEFSRPFAVHKLPNSGSHEKVTANDKERVELAKRLQIPAIHGLEAKLLVKSARGGGVRVSGELMADIEQVSVISLEAFRETVRAEVERVYLPAGSSLANEDSDEDLDTIDGGVIDLGELVTETLALELDPYPRKPGEVFSSAEEPVAETKPNPFATLKQFPGAKPGK